MLPHDLGQGSGPRFNDVEKADGVGEVFPIYFFRSAPDPRLSG